MNLGSYFSLLLVLFLSACAAPAPKQEQPTAPASPLSAANDSLYTLVVKIHDEVMPENNTILGLQQQLKAQLPKLPENLRDSLLPILSELQLGYDGMMDWMRDFRNTELHADEYKTMGDSATRVYLLSEQAKIEQVGRQMRKSIELARTWKSAHPLEK